jgi:hypothetical protein
MRGQRSLTAGVVTGVLAMLLLAGAAGALEVGQKAPDFTLPAPGGKQVQVDLTAIRPLRSSIPAPTD